MKEINFEKILRILGSYGIKAYEEYSRWSKKVKIGFIVNPVAGMGGKLGLKGSDGLKFSDGLKMGAEPVALKRAEIFLNFIKPIKDALDIYSCSGVMGEICLKRVGIDANIVYNAENETSSEDTKNAAKIMKNLVDLIVFVGGDGTARDICSAIGTEIPALGVPAGVKMHSSVFALNVKRAAELLVNFVRGCFSFEVREVMDVDEDAFRSNKIKVKLFGYLRVPVVKDFIQTRKSLHSYENMENIALFLKEIIKPDSLCVLGPGGTVYEVMKYFGIKKTLLGVDLAVNWKLIAKDVGESDILKALNEHNEAYVIVTPIGGQGFLFGRGNQQISSNVLRRIKKENIIVIASESKVKELPELKIDLDDQYVLEKLNGSISVITGYRKFLKVKVVY